MKKRVLRRRKLGIHHIAKGRQFGHVLDLAWCDAQRAPGSHDIIIVLAPRYGNCPECKLRRAAFIEKARAA